MPSSYSLDFRKKVIDSIKKKETISSASKRFSISYNTVKSWYLRYQSEGHYKPKKNLGKKPRLTSEDVDNYIKKNPNFKLEEMGKYFKMSYVGAYYWLKKFGYKYKKNTLPIWNQAKKKEMNT